MGGKADRIIFSDKIMWKSICIWAVVQWWMREIFLNWKIKKFSIPRTSFVVLGNLLGKTPIFQALRYWKILFSPSDFEPTSVRNCQFLTLPVRNCQHADPYQVLGLERSEQQCVLDTRRHLPTPTRYWGTEQPTGRFFKYKLFSLHQVCRKPCQ